MTTYQGNNYASDVYLQDTATGAITRAPEIGISVNYEAQYSDSWSQAIAYKKAAFIYGGAAAGMVKKRKLGRASGPYVYVTSATGNYQLINCYLKSGAPMDDFIMDVPFTFFEFVNLSQEYANHALSDLSINAYANCSRFRTNEIYANQGVLGELAGPPEGLARVIGDVLVTIQTHLGANRPYIVENYEDVVPYVANPYPTSGFVSDQSPATFGWTFAYDATNVAGTLSQGSAKFRWREVGAGTYTEILITGAQNYIIIPAGTFTATNIEWQIVVVSDDGIEGVPSAWHRFTVVDFLSAATPISPVNQYVEIDKPVEFAWDHNIESGTAQTKADLEYSVDNGPWQTLATVNGSAQTVTILADTLPAGRIQWRVRTYNQDGEVGAWSNAVAFMGIGTPQPPSMTGVSNSARPTIRWQAIGQVAYQVRIVREGSIGAVYETGQISGTDKLHNVSKYLYNGNYTAYVRILNASLWSDWSGIGFTIDVTPPLTPTITVEAIADGVKVTIPPVAAKKVILYRNGTPVVDVTGLLEYTDYAALGLTEYYVRVIDEYDSFADSNTTAVTISVRNPQVAAVDALNAPVLLKLTRNEAARLSGNLSQAVSYQYYDGREKPVAVFSGEESESYQKAVAFLSSADRSAMLTLMRRRKTCLYRDAWGNRWYVTIATAGINQDRISTDMALTLTVTDYVEAIEV